MSNKIPRTIEAQSFENLKEVVTAHRAHDGFGSFELFDPVTVDFKDAEPVTFPSGSYASHYGKGALYLTHLTNSYDSVLVRTDGTAEVSHHDLTDPSRFNTWMNTLWNLELPPKN